MTEADLLALAGTIADQIDAGADFTCHSDAIGGDVELAYTLQFAVMDELARRHNTTLGGRKVGFNSPPQMAHLGVDVPPTGYVRTDQIVFADTFDVDISKYHTLAYEPEIAVVLGADFAARDQAYSPADIAAGIERLHLAFELVDPRGASVLELSAADIIAQDILNVGMVVGGAGVAPDDVELDTLQVSVLEGDESVVSAEGTAAQTPVEATGEMVNATTTRGRGIAAGTVLICGAYRGPSVVSDMAVTFTIDQLGSMTLNVSA